MYTVLLAIALCGGQPVRQCVTAPVYQYQHPQYAAGYTYNTIQPVAYVAYDNYYSKLVGSQARQQAAAQSEADLTKQLGLLTTEIGNVRQVLTQWNSLPQVPAPTPTPQPPPPGPPPPPIVPAAPGSDLQKAAAVIIQKKCSACHTGAATAGSGLALLSAPNTLAVIQPLTKLKMDQQVYSGAMPPDPKKALTAEEYSTLRAWINEDRDKIAQILDNYKETTK